ncbi:PCD23-like protein [Mya arenaria]|uniref:PCD23-like protein n=1 Tax=Mya arenaria TaxID=6604 RepID=A0ABY7FUC3_MYAAR|nr:PCD23-like protein [Mya arenaria]
MEISRWLPILLGCSLLHHTTAAYVEIGNLPASVAINEDEDTWPVYLYSVRVYTSGGTGFPSCTLSDTANFRFSATDTVTGQFEISTTSSPSFDYTASPVTLTVECTYDVKSDSKDLTVNVEQNVPPSFSTTTPSVDISAKTTRPGQIIYTFSYTDTDSPRPLHLSVLSAVDSTGADATSEFNVSNDALFLESDIKLVKVTSYTVTVVAGDNERPANSQTFTITVNVNDINLKPEFLINALSVLFPEGTAGRTLLHTIRYSDGNGDPVQIEYDIQDANNAIFDLVPSKSGDNTFTLTVIVNDTNEAPTWTGIPTAISVDENQAVGSVVETLSTHCTDPDTIPPETISYEFLFSTEHTYFAINSSGVVTFAVLFDYDDVNLANEFNLTIRCFDNSGFYDDTYLTVTVNDVNDNSPTCSPSTTSLSLRYDQNVSETIQTLDCTDIDSTVNAELEYSILGHAMGYGTTYFQVDATGNVSISQTFQMDFNTTFYVNILVNDKGTPPLSTTVTLTVTYTERPLNITYSKVEDCFACTTSAITILAAFGLVGFMVTTCFVVLLILKCCYDYEQWKIKKAFSKKRKRSWRCFGCCRPSEREKRTAEKAVARRRRDEEYIRARNQLMGITEEDGLGPEDTVVSSIPTKPAMRKKRPVPVAGPSATASTSLTGRERDQTPDIGIRSMQQPLTTSQKEQLEKFQTMKKNANDPAKHNKEQAASGMVWAFQGRK